MSGRAAGAANGPKPLEVLESDPRGGLPHNKRLEEEVLGAMLAGNEGLRRGRRSGLTESVFHFRKHKIIFGLLAELPLECDSPFAEVGLALGRMPLAEVTNEALSHLFDAGCSASGLEAKVRELLDLSARREVLDAGRDLEAFARDPGEETLQEGLAKREGRLRDLLRGAPGDSLLRAAERLTAEPLRQNERPVPLLGDGVVCKGDLVVFAGQPGLGKSRLMLELAEALTRGEPWLGLETHGGLRVGYLAAEFTRWRWMERCVRLFGRQKPPDEAEALMAAFDALGLPFVVVTADSLRGGMPDLCTEAGAFQLEDLIAERRLDLMVLDPLARLMGGREETNENFGLLVRQLDPVRHRTRAALVLVHHERKAPAGAREQGDLDAIRGGTHLTASATAVMRLVEEKGLLRINPSAKPNFAARLGMIWLRDPGDGGPFQLAEAPEAKADANLALVRDYLREHGTVTAGATGSSLGLSTPTARKHLEALVARREADVVTGPRSSKSYVLLGESGKQEKGQHSFPWEPIADTDI